MTRFEIVDMFKLSIKSIIRKIGLEITRSKHGESAHSLTLRLAELTKSTMFLDVGANEGQFASSVSADIGGARIVSFEPSESAYALLKTHASRRRNWVVAKRVALSDQPGEAILHVSGNSVSSSLLEMEAAHSDAAPQSRYIATETVPCATLDSIVYEDMALHGEKFYLKIDTQGSELKVLLGASKTLNDVVAIQCEVSFVELYKGQPLANEVIRYLKERGFLLFGYANVFRDPKRHELLQADVFFLRDGAAS